MEKVHHVTMSLKRTVDTAGLDVGQAFGQAGVQLALLRRGQLFGRIVCDGPGRFENDLAAAAGDLNIVAFGQANPLTHVVWDGELAFLLKFDDGGHGDEVKSQRPKAGNPTSEGSLPDG